MAGRPIRSRFFHKSRRLSGTGLLVILIPFLLSACASQTDQSSSQSAAKSPVASEKIVYEIREVEKKDPDCGPQQIECSYIKFTYPEIIAGPQKARDAINKAVSDFLLSRMEEGKRFASIDEATDSFLADYQKFKNEYPDATPLYTDDKEIKVVYESPEILSLEFNHGWFTGGAHPNSATTLASYDAVTGEKIKLPDILAADYKSKLDEIGESKFRQVRQITSDMKLSEAGFNFEGDRFTLNDNFLVGKDGITFFFNSYEVAAYAAGPTEITLDYSEIKSLIKPDGPLADRAK